MIIERVRLTRVRFMRDFEAVLGPGLVVLRGPNESGKSTILQSILAAFYSRAQGKAGNLASWTQESMPAIELEVTVEGKSARIEKDFENKEQRVVEGEDEITSARGFQEWVARSLGCPTLDLFVATACVREEEIEIPRVDMKNSCSRQILDRLQSMLTGAPGGSPGEVMQRLKKNYDAIRKRPGPRDTEGGPVAFHRRQLDETRARLKRVRQDVAAWDLAAAELDNLRPRAESMARELEGLKSAIGNNRLHLQAESELKEISEKLARHIKAEQLVQDLARMEKELDRYPGYEALDAEIERLRAVRREKDEKERRLTELGFDKYEMRIETPRAAVGLAALALLLVLAGGAAWLATGAWWPPLLGLAAAAPLMAMAIILRRSAGRKEQGRRLDLDADLRAQEKDLASLETEMSALLQKFRRGSVEDCLSSYREWEALDEKIRTARERVRDLAESGDPDDLARAISELSVTMRAQQERISELDPYRIQDPVRFAGMERDAARREEELLLLSRKLAEAEARVNAASFDSSELAELEEEDAYLESRLAYWERQQRVYEKAIAVLEEATEAVVEKAGDVIEREIAPVISTITGGRYRRARADNQLELSVFSAELNDWVSEKSLSLAATEQLHFAARLALVGLITENKKPPLLLDDPFAHYDRERFEAVMKVIKQVSPHHQVILFTPTDRYDRFADRVVVLGEEEAV